MFLGPYQKVFSDRPHGEQAGTTDIPSYGLAMGGLAVPVGPHRDFDPYLEGVKWQENNIKLPCICAII